jgi:hypothetical protein
MEQLAVDVNQQVPVFLVELLEHISAAKTYDL